MEYSGPAKLKIKVNDFEEKSCGWKKVLFWKILIEMPNFEKWAIEKRYTELVQLQDSLKKGYGNLPSLPDKTFFPLNYPYKREKGINERKKAMERYLRGIVARMDLLSNPSVLEFFQIKKNIHEIVLPPPIIRATLDAFGSGIHDIQFCPIEGLLFVACANQVEVLQRTDDKGYKFDKIATIQCEQTATAIHWDPDSICLAIGFANGTVIIYNTKPGSKYSEFEEVEVHENVHEGAINGVYFDSENKILYSVGEDGYLIIRDTNSKEILRKIDNCHYINTKFISKKRLYVSNKNGQVYVHELTVPKDPFQLHHISTEGNGPVKGMFVNRTSQELYVANSQDGLVAVYDLSNQEAYDPSKLRCSGGRNEISCIAGSVDRAELYIGHDDGSITFWDSQSLLPFYVMEGHHGIITKLEYDPKNQMLITASMDQKICLYELPDEWIKKRAQSKSSHSYYGTDHKDIPDEESKQQTNSPMGEQDFLMNPKLKKQLSPNDTMAIFGDSYDE